MPKAPREYQNGSVRYMATNWLGDLSVDTYPAHLFPLTQGECLVHYEGLPENGVCAALWIDY